VKRLPHLIAAIAAGLFCTTASAQLYPAKPFRIIVPIAAGGVTDILTRIPGQRLTTMWGQQVIVDNRHGGGSNVAIETAAWRPPTATRSSWLDRRLRPT
jgi:tripartite-type tricarboxylate transporter receptor subunit TctC